MEKDPKLVEAQVRIVSSVGEDIMYQAIVVLMKAASMMIIHAKFGIDPNKENVIELLENMDASGQTKLAQEVVIDPELIPLAFQVGFIKFLIEDGNLRPDKAANLVKHAMELCNKSLKIGLIDEDSGKVLMSDGEVRDMDEIKGENFTIKEMKHEEKMRVEARFHKSYEKKKADGDDDDDNNPHKSILN